MSVWSLCQPLTEMIETEEGETNANANHKIVHQIIDPHTVLETTIPIYEMNIIG